MKNKNIAAIVLITLFATLKINATDFNIKKDLLLVNFDCKTDVDDLHTIAAFTTLIADPTYSKLKYYAVAGTYGTQGGLYVPPNDLFQLAFGNNWSDAHENRTKAIKQVKVIALETLLKNGDIWIAEAGQSDFTAQLIKAIQLELPELNVSKRIHVVQHSNWNEKETSPELLQFVKDNSDYQKIPDGNATGNGTPGFRTTENIDLKNSISNPKLIEIWQLAIDLSNKHNGKDGRYKNEAIFGGGFDFSDLSEVSWILGINNTNNVTEFFEVYSN